MVRRETSSIGELNQEIAPTEWMSTEENRAGCRLDISELRTESECSIANSFEVFIEEDALEEGTPLESVFFDCVKFWAS